ncbi:MAG: 2-C-methyl-D-erythritol 2,4-cyclodiphosphate synthase [Cyclobacteriaceae bacterium]
MKFRVGLGFDVHELKDGAPLYLGGVAISSDKGAVGHSDADVLIHAICDAMLGAAGMRDIGFHFSNKDERWRNADSKIFLKEVTRMLSEAGWQTENLDCTLVLEAPKIGNYVSDMKQALAGVIGIEPSDISIKATTNETMGYVGRREGLNAMAVVLISKK